MTDLSRPVAVRLGALGDMVMFLPVVDALSRRFGRPVNVITKGAWSLPLLIGRPSVGDVQLVASTRLPIWLSTSMRRQLRWVRSHADSAFLVFERQPRLEQLLVLGGVGRDRIARLADYPRCHRHEIDDAMAMARGALPELAPALDEQKGDATPTLTPQRAAIKNVEDWLGKQSLTDRPVILIQPGNKRTMRRGRLGRASNHKFWPLERWAAVIDGACSMVHGAAAVVLGVAEERAIATELISHVRHARCVNAAGELPIPELIALGARAHSMISVDTGPAHVAAAAGCPTAVLFGKTDPEQYLPKGPAPTAAIAGADPDLLSIAAERVLDQWQKLVDPRNNL